MATQIAELKQLQDSDRVILALREKIQERPLKLGVHKDVVQQTQQQAVTKKQELLETQKALDSQDVDLREGEEKLKRLKILLNGAKTNEEYSILKRNITDQERKNSQVEEAILEMMGKTDDLREELESLREEEGKSEETLRTAEEEAEREVRALNDTLQERLSEREQLASTIAAEALKQYERIFVQRTDGALAKVTDRVCQGCFISIPPQWVNRLQINKEMVTCPSCGRILFLE